jgi:hypothetical protein
MSGRSNSATQTSTACRWSISASMLRSKCWWFSVATPTPGMLTVCSQRSTPSLDSGSQSRLKTITRIACSTAVAKRARREHGTQAIEAELVPKCIESPDITQAQGRLEAHLQIATRSDRAPLGAQQTIKKRVDLAAALVDATQSGQRPLPRLAVLIPERLDQLPIGAFAVQRNNKPSH